ncbi:MAG: hypothetical protein RL217_871 [Pseudomonadota bacterium]|jgi:anti-anti-sigma factor
MSSASIKVAFENGVHVIRLSGDVRLSQCPALENYVVGLLSHSRFNNLLIDLSQAEGLDSTTLGQLAKISILCRERFGITPTIASPNKSITKLLLSMGFDEVFHIIRDSFVSEGEFCDWVVETWDEEEARQQVVSAHRVLMSLNDKNKNEFRELVDSLESGCSGH